MSMNPDKGPANLPERVYDAFRKIAEERLVTVTPELRAALDLGGWFEAQADVHVSGGSDSVDPQIVGADSTIGIHTTAEETGEAIRDRKAFETDWKIHGRGIERE